MSGVSAGKAQGTGFVKRSMARWSRLPKARHAQNDDMADQCAGQFEPESFEMPSPDEQIAALNEIEGQEVGGPALIMDRGDLPDEPPDHVLDQMAEEQANMASDDQGFMPDALDDGAQPPVFDGGAQPPESLDLPTGQTSVCSNEGHSKEKGAEDHQDESEEAVAAHKTEGLDDHENSDAEPRPWDISFERWNAKAFDKMSSDSRCIFCVTGEDYQDFSSTKDPAFMYYCIALTVLQEREKTRRNRVFSDLQDKWGKKAVEPIKRHMGSIVEKRAKMLALANVSIPERHAVLQQLKEDYDPSFAMYFERRVLANRRAYDTEAEEIADTATGPR